MKTLTLGIVGKGFVGGSVSHGFNVNVKQLVVDPRHTTTSIEDCVLAQPQIIFLCLPTPQSKNGEVDASITYDVLSELEKLEYRGIVVIKSTITPDHLRTMSRGSDLSIVYNPEFLTEANAHWDFCNPPMQVLGGELSDCEVVERAYLNHSSVKVVPTFKVDIASASLLKYTINSWLSTKVTFMNELHELHRETHTNTSWEQFTDMLTRDTRVGSSHMKVPGPDGDRGFGGHCFPKDTSALLAYATFMGADLSVLSSAVEKNDYIRNK
jgi:UDPglucose 6-dehydrogenase